MKHFNQDGIRKRNEKIHFLIEELNSTLDLYYETVKDNKLCKNDQ